MSFNKRAILLAIFLLIMVALSIKRVKEINRGQVKGDKLSITSLIL